MLVTETGENWPGSRRVREEKSELFRWATTWSEWRCLLAASVQSWDSLCLCLPSSLCSIMYTGICQVLLLFVRSGTSLTQFDVSPVLTAKCFCWAYGHWIGQLVSLSLDYLLGWMDDAVWMCDVPVKSLFTNTEYLSHGHRHGTVGYQVDVDVDI